MLDLLVPDLLLPAEAPDAMRGLRLSALERWIARSHLVRVATPDATAWLAAEYALAEPAAVAPIALLGETSNPMDIAQGPASTGAWLRADPVHLRIDRDSLVLHDPAILGVSRAEADALIATFNAHFAPDGLRFVAPHPERWYVQVPEGELPATTARDTALGRNVFGLLPAAGGRINWRSAITESQMVLANDDVNRAREQAGKPLVNSVWFWGGGVLPRVVDAAYANVHAGDVFARGLARASGVHPAGLPAALEALDLAREEARVLVVLDALTAPLRRGDAEAWLAAAAELEAHWFATLGHAIERFGTVRVILPADRGARVATLGARSRWLWYRTRQPLASHA